MIDDDERRDVAARLREQKSWDILTDFEYCIGDLCAAVFEDEGDLNDMFRLQSALADLIEPEPELTCKMIPFVEEDGSIFIVNCSECGEAIFARGGKHDCNYCPSCGAKVIE